MSQTDAKAPLQAEVVVLSPVGGFRTLSYAVPPDLEPVLKPGHLVLVPLRSRKVTGLVVSMNQEHEPTGLALKPIADLLESEPLFDDLHLKLVRFIANYYLASVGEVLRTILPATMRVETRLTYVLARAPNALERAALSETEHRILEVLSQRPRSMRALRGISAQGSPLAAVARLERAGLVRRFESEVGRHREQLPEVAILKQPHPAEKLRGNRQQKIVALLSSAGPAGMSVDTLRKAVPAAREVLEGLIRRGLVELKRASCHEHREPRAADLPSLTEEQRVAVETVARSIIARRFDAYLLFGVTGSGKTEVYLRLVAQALEVGLNALVMVPEIALTEHLVTAFRARFGEQVAVMHSGQRISERWAALRSTVRGLARIIIGPRSAIFAPIRDLGLAIVDEEHDPAYKNDQGVRYHARDLAVMLARLGNFPVVLGSATPSAESFANVRAGRYRILRLQHRILDRTLASVEIVDLRREPVACGRGASPSSLERQTRGGPAPAPEAAHQVRPFGPEAAALNDAGRLASAAVAPGQTATAEPGRAPLPLSQRLLEALRENLAAGGQSIIFLNRRGFHNFLQCRLCGTVPTCRNCSVALSFHLRDRSLRCHYCGSWREAPDECPDCRSYSMEGHGFGTERVATVLREMLPGARVERLDGDTSRKRGSRERVLEQLARGELDVLVGTQMITKGFDFPGVTMVGVILADQGLNVPDFRSAERTFQLLTQVSGRAGRGERPGKVIIQTYAPHHYSIRAAAAQDYPRFIRRELDLRREHEYPPFSRLALVRTEGTEPAKVQTLATKIAERLAGELKAHEGTVLGPAPAPIERLKGRYRWQVLGKARSGSFLRSAVRETCRWVAEDARSHEVRIIADIDPVDML